MDLFRSALECRFFERELLAFPNGNNDDIIDSVTQFLHWFETSGEYLKGGLIPLGDKKPHFWQGGSPPVTV